MYDVSKHKGTNATCSSFASGVDNENPNDTFHRVLHQVQKRTSKK